MSIYQQLKHNYSCYHLHPIVVVNWRVRHNQFIHHQHTSDEEATITWSLKSKVCRSLVAYDFLISKLTPWTKRLLHKFQFCRKFKDEYVAVAKYKTRQKIKSIGSLTYSFFRKPSEINAMIMVRINCAYTFYSHFDTSFILVEYTYVDRVN